MSPPYVQARMADDYTSLADLLDRWDTPEKTELSPEALAQKQLQWFCGKYQPEGGHEAFSSSHSGPVSQEVPHCPANMIPFQWPRGVHCPWSGDSLMAIWKAVANSPLLDEQDGYSCVLKLGKEVGSSDFTDLSSRSVNQMYTSERKAG
jgi:hypothetical protein